jgi:hypothetical protein
MRITPRLPYYLGLRRLRGTTNMQIDRNLTHNSSDY